MDSNGVSREGPFTPTTLEDDDYMRIEMVRSPSPDIELQDSRRRGLLSEEEEDDMRIEPVESHTPELGGHKNSRRRGLSEAQQLLAGSDAGSERNSFEVEVKNAFRYVAAPVGDEENADADTDRRRGSDGLVSGDPQPLKAGRGVVKDLFMIGVTLPFFGLAAGVIYFDGNATTEYFEKLLDNCTKVAATFFPIIFSMIVGRAVYKIASWKLERGSSVGLLEQLLNSRTFSSTFLTQLALRTSPLIAISLILLWIFSPLGSQAALRMLTTKTLPTTTPNAITYINTRQPIYSGNSFGSWFPGFATLFSASLVAPLAIKTGPSDTWGNVKIPYFSSLADIPMDQAGWKSVPVSNFTPTYSSLFGIPISSIADGNTTFTLESTYLSLTCSTRATEKIRDGDRIASFDNPDLISTNGLFKSAENVTAFTNWAVGYLGEDITPLLPSTSELRLPCLDCLPTNANDTKYAGILLYQDFTGAENVTSIYCNPSQVYVESRISCTSSDRKECVVTAQRESLLPHTPSKITLLSFAAASLGLSKFLPNATHPSVWLDQIQNYLVNPIDNTYIQSTPFAYLTTSASQKESQLQTLPIADFSLRLGQLINAFLYGSMWNSTQYLTGSPFPQNQQQQELSPPTTPTGRAILNTQATTTTTNKLFKISLPWLTIYLLSTLLLLLASLTSLVLSYSLLTPSYLGYVSTLVREASHITDTERFTAPAGMGGLKRAREMEGVRVRLGDVGDLESGFEVGTGVEVRVGRMAIGGLGGTRGVGRGGRLFI